MDSRWRLDMDALRSGRAQERAGIILKYEQGPRKGPQFHLGEEDNESGALVPDKLGFLRKQKPPRHGCLAVQWHKHQEGRRLQKWNKMLRNFTKYRSSEKVPGPEGPWGPLGVELGCTVPITVPLRHNCPALKGHRSSQPNALAPRTLSQ
nr:TBC1 domain family member 28-like isoform X2 [Oryctolagus cuniculus]